MNRIQRTMEFHNRQLGSLTCPIHATDSLRPHSTDDGQYTMDIYNTNMNYMWESAPGIEPGSPSWKARRVTAHVQTDIHTETDKQTHAQRTLTNKHTHAFGYQTLTQMIKDNRTLTVCVCACVPVYVYVCLRVCMCVCVCVCLFDRCDVPSLHWSQMKPTKTLIWCP